MKNLLLFVLALLALSSVFSLKIVKSLKNSSDERSKDLSVVNNQISSKETHELVKVNKEKDFEVEEEEEEEEEEDNNTEYKVENSILETNKQRLTTSSMSFPKSG